MFQRLPDWLTARFGRERAADTDEEDTDNRFVPSALDASVRDAHGGSGGEGERELASIQAKARRLQSQRREE